MVACLMDVTNKTKRPIKVPLPGGKRLFLGPGAVGQIAPKATEHPPLKKLLEAGDLEVKIQGRTQGTGSSGGSTGPSQAGGGQGGGLRHTGDR